MSPAAACHHCAPRLPGLGARRCWLAAPGAGAGPGRLGAGHGALVRAGRRAGDGGRHARGAAAGRGAGGRTAGGPRCVGAAFDAACSSARPSWAWSRAAARACRRRSGGLHDAARGGRHAGGGELGLFAQALRWRSLAKTPGRPTAPRCWPSPAPTARPPPPRSPACCSSAPAAGGGRRQHRPDAARHAARQAGRTATLPQAWVLELSSFQLDGVPGLRADRGHRAQRHPGPPRLARQHGRLCWRGQGAHLRPAGSDGAQPRRPAAMAIGRQPQSRDRARPKPSRTERPRAPDLRHRPAAAPRRLGPRERQRHGLAGARAGGRPTTPGAAPAARPEKSTCSA
jgi:hypothetical protein